LTATKPSPSDVERDEVDDDIPTRFFANVIVDAGSRKVKIDTGAFAIWVCATVHREIGTEPLATAGDANAEDGRALPVLGSYYWDFGGAHLTYLTASCVPCRLASSLDAVSSSNTVWIWTFASLRGSFHKVIRGRRAVFSGRLRVNSGPEGEELAVMQEADLEDVFEEMDLADLGEEAEAMRAVLRRNIEVFRGPRKAEGEEFHIKVPPNFNMSQLDCPQHRRSEKETVFEEADETRLMTLGVIEPSDALEH
jgi:hypothetical protein